MVQAVREGNLLRLNNALEEHNAFFIRCGVYLILEKLKVTVYRNLFKKVSVEISYLFIFLFWLLFNSKSCLKITGIFFSTIVPELLKILLRFQVVTYEICCWSKYQSMIRYSLWYVWLLCNDVNVKYRLRFFLIQESVDENTSDPDRSVRRGAEIYADRRHRYGWDAVHHSQFDIWQQNQGLYIEHTQQTGHQ